MVCCSLWYGVVCCWVWRCFLFVGVRCRVFVVSYCLLLCWPCLFMYVVCVSSFVVVCTLLAFVVHCSLLVVGCSLLVVVVVAFFRVCCCLWLCFCLLKKRTVLRFVVLVYVVVSCVRCIVVVYRLFVVG